MSQSEADRDKIVIRQQCARTDFVQEETSFVLERQRATGCKTVIRTVRPCN